MDKKIKVLVVPSDNSGCGKFRSKQPHVYLQEHFGEYFDVDIRMMGDFPSNELDKFFSQYDIVHIHKQLDKECKLIDMIKFLGVKVIVDVDDHWLLGDYHPMSIAAKKERWDLPIIEHLRRADYVTTTTPIFADVIKKYNENVIVLPNAIDPSEEQFIEKPKKTTQRLRIGLVCGSSHLHDFKLLEGMTASLPKEIIDKVQFVLCGFDTRGTKTIYYTDIKKTVRKPIEPKESVWYEYEKIITNNYKIVDDHQKRFLDLFVPNSEYPNEDTAYKRCWTKDISRYATHYNDIDVLLVPLKECEFNKVKSQLKVIEAGFMHKVIIANNYGPYTIDLKPMIEKGGGVNEDGNALLVESSKNHKQWAKYIKKLVENPEMVTKLQENLYNTVKDTYSLETVTRNRANKYLEIMGRKERGYRHKK